MKLSRYWILQIAPLLLISYGAVHFHDFLALAIRSNPELNLTIMGVIVASACVCLWRMCVFAREANAIARFEREYGRTRSTQASAQAVGQSRTYMAGLLHVVGDMRGPLTSRLNQAALHLEFEELRSSYAQMLSLPQFLSGFMIALGLFGTFIGLLDTLQATASFISVVADSSGGDANGAIVGLIKGIQGPLKGMGTAFSASLFGLLGSLVTGAMLNGLQSLAHKLVHGTRRMVEQILPVEAEDEVDAVAGTGITPEQLMGVADRLLRYEKSAAELYVRSRQADMETRAQIKDVSLHLATLLTTLDGLVRELVPGSQAMAQQSAHTADLLHELRRQGGMLAGVHDMASAVATAAERIQHTGSTMERVLASAMAQRQQSALMEGQVSRSHALLGDALQRLTERQAANDALLARIAEGAATLPALSQQLAEWTPLATRLAEANGAWLKDVQDLHAESRADMQVLLDRMAQAFDRLARLNADTTGQTQRLAADLARPPSPAAADILASLRALAQSLAAVQAGQDALLKDAWRRHVGADGDNAAH